MKVLMAGDIAGSSGRTVLARVATRMKAKGQVHLVIANAENAAGGKGLTEEVADELFAGGVDILTLGDHTWDQKSLVNVLDRESRILRPANFAPGCPGKGHTTIETQWGRVTIINLIGRVFMNAYDCPFRTSDAILSDKSIHGSMIFVDIHAEATSEKVALGRYLDGRVTAVAGTHTHVQTSDERILTKGTAYITDLGMTGPHDGILGRNRHAVLKRMRTDVPARFSVSEGDVCANGVLVDIDPSTGRALSIERVAFTYDPKSS